MKKPIETKKWFSSAPKIFTLFLLFVFLRMPIIQSADAVFRYRNLTTENERHRQKTMQTHAECDGAVARVWVSFLFA